jgi:membrane fusion protein (multidrug efflux system)
MTKRKRYIIGIALLVIVATAFLLRALQGSGSGDARRPSLIDVKLERPAREDVVYTLQFTGDVVAIQQANIFSKVMGTLEKTYVDMGTPVRQGHLLALIDTTELYQTYEQAAATFLNAQLNYRRTKELFEQTLVARQDLDNAEAALKIAQAASEAASTRLGYAHITAPFSGTVTKRFLDPGSVLTSTNTTLFTLMDLDVMKVMINLLEKDIPKVERGKAALVTVDAFPGREFHGTVERYSQAVDLSTRTMAVEIDIPNPDHLLRPGMFASVTLIVDRHGNALTVPTQALLKDDNGYFVYTVAQDTARRIPVIPGVEQHSRTEILSGLQGDEPVITTGQQFTKNGGAVRVQREK